MSDIFLTDLVSPYDFHIQRAAAVRKDDYFLQNVEVIDGVTAERVQRLVNAVDWPPASVMQRSVSTWPCYNVLADLGAPSLTMCDACCRNQVHAKIILYGQPYNPTTLDGTSIPDINTQKDFMICLECIKWVQLYNKLVHQKYIMYIECAKRVAENKMTDRNKDTTVVLNELLADEEWLSKLFRQVRVTWADVEKAEREKQKKLGAKDPQEQRNSLNEENTTNKEVVESRSVDEITNITNIKVKNETENLEPSGETLVEKTTLVQNDVEVLEPNIQNSENKEEDEIRGNKSFSTAESLPHEERTLNDQETSVH